MCTKALLRRAVDRNQRHPSQPCIGGKQNRQDTDDAQDRHGALLCAVDQDPLHGIDISTTRVIRSPKTADRNMHGQPLEARIDLAAHVENDVLLETVVDANADIVEEVAGKTPQQRETLARQLRLPPANDFIDDQLRELG